MRHARIVGLLLFCLTGCRSVLGIPDEAQLEQANLVISSGGGETGVVGSSLPGPYIVTVELPDHTPVAGVTLEFVVTAGNGTLTGVQRTTDALGKASATLTLGTTAGVNTVEVRAPDGIASSHATFTATGLPGAAARLVLGSGDGQMATVGHALPAPFVAVVQDEFGNAVAGVDVQFAVTSSGGATVDVDSATTDAEGHAATTLTLATTTGVNTVEARATGLSGSPVVFAATGLVDTPTHIEATSGDGQSATVGVTLAAPVVVTVRDGHSNVVPGVTVDFVVTSGNGNPSVASSSTVTDADGQASTTFSLGVVPGLQEVEARATGLTGSPVVFSATATQIAFAPRFDFGTGQAPVSVAFGDVNGDGKLDLAVANSSSNTVSVLLNTTAIAATSPSFAAKVDFGTGSQPLSVAFGDVNGDGKMDLAVANFSSNTVSVLLNTTAIAATSPTFAAKVDFGTGSNPYSVAFGDVNGDGKGDFAVANSSSNTVSVLLNTTAIAATSPSFAARVDFGTGSTPRSVAFGDVNGDGKMDLAVANGSSGTVSVLLNATAMGATSPSFAAKVDFGTGFTLSVVFGDINGDGKMDLAAANGLSGTASVLLNATAMGATAPSFAAKVDFGTGAISYSVALGHVNEDGKMDLAVVNGNSVSVLLNATAMMATVPSFAAKVDFGTGPNPQSVAFGDVNKDGKMDLAVANADSGTVSVLLNL